MKRNTIQNLLKGSLIFLVCPLMMFLNSCNTTKVIEKPVYFVPEIDFPVFPELGEYEKLENGKISTDEDFFRKLLTFRTVYNDAVEKYNESKFEGAKYEL